MSHAVHRNLEPEEPSGRAVSLLRLARDSSGNVLPLTAAGMLVLTGLIGGGVDMARAYKAERRLQAACDAGVLAGRRAVGTNGFDAAAETQARQYFAANYDEESQQTENTLFTPTTDDDGGTVEATATATLPTVIMAVFGYDSLDLGVACSASMGVGNSDIVFVLDNTGSMLWSPSGQTWGVAADKTRIFALRQSMKSFYDTVEDSVANSNARIRYGFVPYSSSVNVGQLLFDEDPSYLADEITVQSANFVNWSLNPIDTWTSEGFTYTSANYGGWSRYSSTAYGNNNCGNKVPADTAWSDSGSPTESVTYSIEGATGHQIKTIGIHQEQTRIDYSCRWSNYYDAYFVYERTGYRQKRSSVYEERAPVPVTAHNAPFADAILGQRTINVATYKTFASTNTPVGERNDGRNTDFDDSSTWEGCIIERETTAASAFSFVSLLTGITPGAALDLDIDLAPTNDPATKWGPMWPEVTYSHDADVLFEAVDKDSSGIDEDELEDEEVASYCPYRSQLLAEMDEDDFDDYADSLVATGSTYHDIGLLWGARISSPTGIFADNVMEEPGNGGTVSRHLIFMTDGELAPSLDINSSYGIERLDKRITGNANSSTQWNNHRSRFLAVCEAIKARGIRLWVIAFGTSLSADLTTCGSPNSSFEADDAEELDENFQEIANQVGELRVIQ